MHVKSYKYRSYRTN